MRVLFLYPPITLHEPDYLSCTLPLGISYLAAIVRENGHKVFCLDCLVEDFDKSPKKTEEGFYHYGLDLKKLETKIRKIKPDIVGISCTFTIMWENVVRIADIIKNINKDIKIVIGGAHPSALPELCLLNSKVDFIVIGEGEKTFVELLEHLEKGKPRIKSINGLCYKKDKKIFRNEQREYIQDLDSLLFPARDLLPFEKYIGVSKSHGSLKRDRYAGVISSRGCPGNCIYCSIHSVWGFNWRPRSAKKTVDEIEMLVEKYKVREIHFEDDNLTLNKKRMIEICDMIKERGLDITWMTPNGVAINTLDREVLKRMKDSGCYQLCFGIESGNENIRNNVIGKPIFFNHAKNIVKYCKDLNIWTHGFFIIGLPGETERTMLDTLKCAKNLDLDSADFFIATPYPGTRLYNIAIEKGYLSSGYDPSKFRVTSAILNTEHFKAEDLFKLKNRFYKNFVIHRMKREIISMNLLKRIGKIRNKDDVNFFKRKMLKVLR